jgi:hypothetical protein
MKLSNIDEAKKLIEHYKKLEYLRTCGCIILRISFLWVNKNIPVSMDAANLCIEFERKKTEERLKELGVEVNE